MDWITLIEGLFGGGILVGIFTIPATIKKAHAEARAAEIDNMKSVADGWKELADERQEACAEKDRIISEKDAKIDALYVQIGEQREEKHQLMEENTRLQVKIATDEVRLCMKRGCKEREPQSGY